MSELVLTEEEKAMSIMDTPDKPLADAVRHCYALMHTVAEKLDKPVLAVAAQHMCVFLAKEINAGSLTYTIEGLTCRDDDLGNWSIEIKRLGPLPPPPSTEPAPQDTGETLRLKAHSWSDTSLYSETTGQQVCTHSIYGEATEDTQDELESLQARNMERLRDCWNLLAGHDLSQVVVVKKEVVEEVRAALQYGCASDKFTRELCREALASLSV